MKENIAIGNIVVKNCLTGEMLPQHFTKPL